MVIPPNCIINKEFKKYWDKESNSWLEGTPKEIIEEVENFINVSIREKERWGIKFDKKKKDDFKNNILKRSE